MNTLAQIWSAGDAMSRAVALLLLAMSVSAWVVIPVEGLGAARVRIRSSARAVPAFWAAPDLQAGRERRTRSTASGCCCRARGRVAAPQAGTLDAGSGTNRA